MEIRVRVERGGERLSITSTNGFSIQVPDWGLEAAHKALMTLCGHESLSESFPVNFDLHLERSAP
jgi:hypothetical protein